MYWADQIAQELKKRNLSLEWIDDMKTPSGFAHVGSLRGPLLHSLMYRCLTDAKIKTKFSFVINDFDPADELPPEYKESLKQYLGFPLCQVPSPDKNFDSLGSFLADDFIKTFKELGVEAQILSSWDLYHQGKFDEVITIALNNAEKIQDIYCQMSGSKKKEIGWLPFQVICEKCGKLGTTKVYKWDKKLVYYRCEPDLVKWAHGCGYEGKISPYGGTGKLPWKVDWPAHWKILGVTVEGAGKDHGSAGGSYDIAMELCDKVYHFQKPYKFVYEFLLVSGQKMSSSKGLGFKAHDLTKILPPNVTRFLFTRTDFRQAINFDPGGNTIPDLFDEYDRCCLEYWHRGKKSDFGRIFELSQVDPKKSEKPVEERFRQVVQWIQMPNMAKKLAQDSALKRRAEYAKIWLEKFAPEDEKFTVKDELPQEAEKLTQLQKKLLVKIGVEIDKKWEAEDFQQKIYQWGKELGLTSKETFQSIYLVLLGRDHGPKAAWLILSLDKEFVKKRFEEVALKKPRTEKQMALISEEKVKDVYKNIYYIDPEVKAKFPGMKTGIAIIEGVTIKKRDNQLEKEKQELIKQLSKLTTEDMGRISSIVAYRKIFKAFGIDWHSRHPSADALLRRVIQGKGLYNINTFVDAYNLAVLESKIALGAFEYEKVSYPVVLRLAKEGEKAYLLGDTEPTFIKEGEMVYADQDRILTLDLNYRDNDYTKVTEKSKNIVLFADGCPGISDEEVMMGLEKGIEYTMRHCGGKLKIKEVISQ